MHEDRPGRPDDAALVRMVAGGSFDALANLYDRHADAVFAAACRLTSDRGVAEEVVQDTFLALWDRAESFDPTLGSLSAWLHTIARNRTVDRLRAAGRRPQFVAPPSSADGDESETQLLERAASSGTIVAGSVELVGPEGGPRVQGDEGIDRAALGAMATEERTVIVLAYREEPEPDRDRATARLAARYGEDTDATGAAAPARGARGRPGSAGQRSGEDG